MVAEVRSDGRRRGFFQVAEVPTNGHVYTLPLNVSILDLNVSVEKNPTNSLTHSSDQIIGR